MAMGIPVLASDIGGHAELVSDGETGLLFKAESPESLVEQATRLGRGPEPRAQLGGGGAARDALARAELHLPQRPAAHARRLRARACPTPGPPVRGRRRGPASVVP